MLLQRCFVCACPCRLSAMAGLSTFLNVAYAMLTLPPCSSFGEMEHMGAGRAQLLEFNPLAPQVCAGGGCRACSVGLRCCCSGIPLHHSARCGAPSRGIMI